MAHVQRLFLVLFLAGGLLGLNWLTSDNSEFERIGQSERKEFTQKISSLNKEIAALQDELALLRDRDKRQEQTAIPIQSTTLRWGPDAKDDPFLGEPNAPVLIVAFSDYQCKPCKEFVNTTLPKLQKEYIETKKVKFVFRDFPLSKHKHAPTAAAIAHCAGEQGQYWKMHDALFEKSNLVDAGDFSKIYHSFKKIDSIKLERCVESQRYGKEIISDAEAGMGLGAKGAPGFFIGTKLSEDTFSGAFIRGAQPFEVFKSYVTQLLNAKS